MNISNESSDAASPAGDVAGEAPESAAPMQDGAGVIQGSGEQVATSPPRHVLRWLALAVASSAAAATVCMVLLVVLALPLSFPNTVLLSTLAGVLLPLLVALLAWRRRASTGALRAWVLMATALTLLLGAVIIIL